MYSYDYIILGVMMMACCAYEPPESFHANRSFIFCLRDKLNVIFVGRISML